jgi:hypothetical protein
MVHSSGARARFGDAPSLPLPLPLPLPSSLPLPLSARAGGRCAGADARLRRTSKHA